MIYLELAEESEIDPLLSFILYLELAEESEIDPLLSFMIAPILPSLAFPTSLIAVGIPAEYRV